MRFTELEVSNFRAIHHARFDELSNLVLVAGPNGVGKSCVLDALRLLKSAYAGYQPYEINNWLTEFQIDVNRKDAGFQRIFRDVTKPVTIRALVELTDSERTFLESHAEELVRNLMWRKVVPGHDVPFRAGRAALAGDSRSNAPEVDRSALSPSSFVWAAERNQAHVPEVNNLVDRALPDFRRQLETKLHAADVRFFADAQDQYEKSLILEVLWGTFAPGDLGIIDYHSAQRSYQYEQVGNINLNIQATDERVRQHALYQTASKYSNIKSEMATAYVRDLIARDSGEKISNTSIIDTLKELFSKFFPGKEFLGPVPAPDGSLSFPVRLKSDGSKHDVDFLSSGEKEVLFGYLRLRNSAPKNSVILIDEPELHLNPRLVKELPGFYDRHIGQALGNQVWLVTHSDAFLREAMAIPKASVWHMQEWREGIKPPTQCARLSVQSDVLKAVLDLVGEIVGYRPGAKVVIVEGEGSEFDKEMISRLFPDFDAAVNIISAGGRSRVERLHELLSKATDLVGWEASFYSITDADEKATQSETEKLVDPKNAKKWSAKKWDAYHIENYLLNEEFIHKVLTELGDAKPPVDTVYAVKEMLDQVAKTLVDEMVKLRLRDFVHKTLSSCLNLRLKSPPGKSIGEDFAEAAEKTKEAVNSVVNGELLKTKLLLQEKKVRAEFEGYVDNGLWRKSFRGKNVLKAFVERYSQVDYARFLRLIIARMRDASFEPPGMKTVLDSILSDRNEDGTRLGGTQRQ